MALCHSEPQTGTAAPPSPAIGQPSRHRGEPDRRPGPDAGAEVEAQVQHALRDEDLGPVQVRFRVCREEAEGFRFICKVENPPRVDDNGNAPPWRWWSPLLETPAQLRESLEEGLQIRRHRLALVTNAR